MSGHGGNRSGAGRPKGGVSQTRRLVFAALTKGLAHAGQTKFPHLVSKKEEDAAVQTAAMIVSDMIQSGQQAEVLKLWAQTATKEPDSQNGSGKTGLEAALSSLPSASCVSLVPQSSGEHEQKPAIAGTYAAGTTDNESDAPSIPADGGTFFAPQQPLLIDVPGTSQSEGGHPPSAPSRTSIYPDTENFEKNQTEPDFGEVF